MTQEEKKHYITLTIVNQEGKQKKHSKEGELTWEILTMAISVVVASYLFVCLPARLLLT